MGSGRAIRVVGSSGGANTDRPESPIWLFIVSAASTGLRMPPPPTKVPRLTARPTTDSLYYNSRRRE